MKNRKWMRNATVVVLLLLVVVTGYAQAQITPRFHLTGDLQILEAAFKGEQSTAIVMGMRAKIDF